MKLQCKRVFRVIWILCLLNGFCSPSTKQEYFIWQTLGLLQEELAQAYFSYPGRYVPSDQKQLVKNKILSLLRRAEYEVFMYVYSLNHPEVIEELSNARKRGVKIHIIGDSEKKYRELRSNGFEVALWKSSGLHHVKILLVDAKHLFLGTGNFSRFGLEYNYNGYISLYLDKEESRQFKEFLQASTSIPFLNLQGFTFVNAPAYGYLIQDYFLYKIANARETIQYLIFDHFDPIFTHALRRASARGISVEGIYDTPADEEGKYLADHFLGFSSHIYEDGNIDVTQEGDRYYGGLLHHKTMVIDGNELLTGSYNFSQSARNNNREIFIITQKSDIVNEFNKEFTRIKDYAKELAPNKHRETHYREQEIQFVHDSAEICFSPLPYLEDPIIELGSGIWKVYLRYSKWHGDDCLRKNSYDSISNSYSINRFAYPYRNASLWGTLQLFSRNHNILWKNQSLPISKNEFSVDRFLEMQAVTLQTLIGGGFLLQSKTLQAAEYQLHLIQVGKGWQSSRILQNAAQTNYKTENALKWDIDREGMIFIEQGDKVYFACFLANKELTEKNILIHTINLRRNLLSLPEFTCKNQAY